MILERLLNLLKVAAALALAANIIVAAILQRMDATAMLIGYAVFVLLPCVLVNICVWCPLHFWRRD
jgi:ammonia channel protein AmtB